MKKLLLLLGLLFTTNAIADNNSACTNSQDCYNSGVYIYEGGQDLIDLYNMSGTTNLNASDDQYSSQVSLGMEWNRWGQTWSHARMSTNGCVNLRSGSAGGNSSNCSDFTPQSLPYRDYTLYPLWTDLIRGTASGGQASKMLFKDFGDYAVFGWYYLREFQRSSSNSFEAILYANNSFEYRYRELDIINHDVVIGEQGKHSTTPTDTKTFLYYNDGQSGYATLDTYLAGYGGPDIENGGSLYSGTEAQMCEIDALYASTCSGYAAAYLAQQCGLNPLHNESCAGYAAANLIYECDLDVFYSSACDGYSAALAQEQALEDAIYGTDENQYGYDDGYDEYGNEEYTDYGYDDEYLGLDDPCSEGGCAGETIQEEYGTETDESMGIYAQEEAYWEELYEEEQQMLAQEEVLYATDADWDVYEVEEFGQEQVDAGEFSEEGFVAEIHLEELYEEEFYEVEILEEAELLAQNLTEQEIYILEETIGIEIFAEEEWEPVEENEIYAEELEDFEREAIEEHEEEVFEEFDEAHEEDEEEFFKEEKGGETKSTRFIASSTQAAVSAIAFGGTQEEQVTAAEVLQEQLDEGSGSTTGGSFDSNSYSSGVVAEQQEQSTGQVQIQVAEIVDSGPAVTAFEVAEQQEEEQQELTFDDGSNFTIADQNFESSFDDALGTGQSIGQFLSNTAPDFAKFEVEAPTFQEQRQSSAVESLADSVSSAVIASNLQAELNKLQQDNENTNDYGDQTIAVSYIGYSAGFSEYTAQPQLADKQSWYDSSQVYKGQKTTDNVVGFYRMAGKTQEKLQEMIHSQYNR